MRRQMFWQISMSTTYKILDDGGVSVNKFGTTSRMKTCVSGSVKTV